MLRRAPPAGSLAGGVVLGTDPPRGRSHRRQSAAILGRPDPCVGARGEESARAALLDLHGHLPTVGRPDLAPDVRATAVHTMVSAVRTHHSEHPAEPRLPVSALRILGATSLRSLVPIARQEATHVASSLIDELVLDDRLVRHDEHVCMPGSRPAAADPGLGVTMDRLVTLLDTTMPRRWLLPRPRPAARLARCGSWSARGASSSWPRTWPGPRRRGRGYVTRPSGWPGSSRSRRPPCATRPAAAVSTSWPLLEDLDRRGLLRRTPAGHVPGSRAPA